MPLPLPPQVPGAPIGQPQGIIHRPGALPYQQSGAANILQGVASFAKDMRASLEADKTKAQQEFAQQMQMIQQGIPLDLKAVAKTAQKAGIPFDFSAPSAEQINFEKEKAAAEQSKQQAQLLQAGGGVPSLGLGGAGLQTAAAGGGVPTAAPPPQAPTQKPSGWERFAQGLGWGFPSPSPMSPGMQFLEAAVRSGKQGTDIKKLMGEADFKTQIIRQAALMGDPRAVEMYTRLGGMKELTTEFAQLKEVAKAMGLPESRAAEVLLDKEMGGPQMRQLQMKAAMDQVQRDVDLRLKATDQARQYLENFPGLDPEVAFQLAIGSATGNKELFEGAVKVLRATKSKEELERGDKAFDKQLKTMGAYIDMEKLKVDKERLKQGWSSLDKEQQRIQLEKVKIDTEIVRHVRAAMGDDFDRYYKIAVNDKLASGARDAALHKMVNAANALGDIKVKTTDGKEIGVSLGKLTKDEWSWIIGAMPFSGITRDPWSTLGTTKPEFKPSPQSQTSPAWWQQLMAPTQLTPEQIQEMASGTSSPPPSLSPHTARPPQTKEEIDELIRQMISGPLQPIPGQPSPFR